MFYKIFFSTFFLTIATSGILSASMYKFDTLPIEVNLLNHALYSDSNKQKIWDEMANEVDHWVDAIGCPIDNDIKEIVVALNVMGIETRASCEGHLNRGCSYPWVDLEIDIEKFRAGLKQIGEKIGIEETSLEAKYPDLSWKARVDQPEAKRLLELYKERIHYSNLIDQAKMHCIEPLNQFLNQFYESRNFSYDRTLTISEYGRLRCVGADRQVIRPEDEQNQKIAEYREEMNAFATFLKKKFMESK